MAYRLLISVEQRGFDAALDALKGHDFRLWKPARVIRLLFVLANLEKDR